MPRFASFPSSSTGRLVRSSATLWTAIFWQKMEEGLARLRADPVAWQEYQDEIALWDTTSGDGLEEYEIIHPAGQMLIDNRSMFLSTTISKSFGGYARAPAQRLKNRGDSFSSDTRNRTAKHARHCFRLMRQGAELLQTGTMSLRVTNREELFSLGEMPVDQIVERFEDEFARFDAVETSLLDDPDLVGINRMLLEIRETYG
ncbi:MAG: hypothetical protein H0U38_03970 [Chloroflexia bacterium]|jgi:hypothetical protein|nr:hypothetical protein [Chloroflexia bacterium]